MRKILCVTLCAMSSGALAQETAAVMPKGIFRARMIGVSGVPITERFDSAGERIPLLAPLNRSVGAAQQASQNAELKELYDKLNEFDKGLGDALLQSNFETTSQINFSRKVFALEYGLTSRLTLGMILTYAQMNVRSRFSATTTTQTAAIKERVKGITPLEDGLDKFESMKPDTAVFAKAVFSDKGYNVPGDYSYGGLSDTDVGGNYQIYNSDRARLAVQLGTRLPTTSHKINYANILDKGIGDKQLSLGMGFFAEYLPNSNLVFGSMAKFSTRVPDNVRMPVLRKGEQDLPDLTNPENWDSVRRKLGDALEAELATTYYFGEKGWNLYGAYQFSLKGRDSYSGSRTDLDYVSLEKDTKTIAHKTEAGLGYSTIPLYFKKKWPVPFDLKYGYNQTFLGTNTPKVAYHRFNFLLYF